MGDPDAAPRGSAAKMEFNAGSCRSSFPSAAWKLGSPGSFLAVPGGGCGLVMVPFLGPRIESDTVKGSKRVFTSVVNNVLYGATIYQSGIW